MGASDLAKQFSGHKGKSRQVELCIYVVLALGVFLVLFGSSRRRCSNVFLRILTMLALISSFTLITFIVGLMVFSPVENIFFPVWAAYMAIFFGNPDAISAYAPEDNEQWRKLYFSLLIELFWVGGVITSQRPKYKPFMWVMVGILMPSLYAWKAVERVQALGHASKNGLAMSSKLVADFMSYESGFHGRESSLFREGFQYLVGRLHKFKGSVTCTPGGESRIAVTDDKVITVEKVWNCEGRLLSTPGDEGSKMKDVCLSFSLYNLLCCHFAGYSFPRSTRDKQCEFVRDVLLQDVGNEDGDYERPFQVIELELGYLYDRFYTKYAVISIKPWSKLCRFVALCFISFVIHQLFLIPLEDPITFLRYEQDVTELVMLDRYILVTRIIMGVVVFLETLQLLLFAISNWGKLLYLCKYVEKPSWRNSKLYEQFVGAVCNFPRQKLWAGELGQYSFLESFDKNRVLMWISNHVTYPYLENPGIRCTRVTLSPEVKRAVLSWIKQKGARLTNGRASLIENGVKNKELLSVCECNKISRVVMVWHIATSLCEFKRSKSPSLTGDEGAFVVSMTLSKYCAYLVVSVSRLIPDHSFDAYFLFRHSILVTKSLTRGCKSTESKYTKIMRYAKRNRAMKERSVVEAGGRVAKLLMKEVGNDVERLWKILADFWTEMVLFVAPCDDPRAHAECLAQGGEFVTHLWALLLHSGIATRECIEDSGV